jgi:hypothetical protein
MSQGAEQNLHDIEAIRQLKARYVRFGDEQSWDEFRELFTEDCEFVLDVMPRKSQSDPLSATIHGIADYMAGMPDFLEGVVTTHQVYSSEITLTAPDRAEGIWSMHDHVEMPRCVFKGYGHYREIYVKIDGVWKIRRTHTTRLRWEEHWR